MQLSQWIKVVQEDAKKAEQAVLGFLSKAVPAVDSAINLAVPILAVVDPQVVPAVKAAEVLIDEVYAAIQGMEVPAAGGTVSVSLNSETVASLLKAGTDAKAWLASVGVKP